MFFWVNGVISCDRSLYMSGKAMLFPPSRWLLEEEWEEEVKQLSQPWKSGMQDVTARPDCTHIFFNLPSHFPHRNPWRKLPLSLFSSWSRSSFLPRVILGSKLSWLTSFWHMPHFFVPSKLCAYWYLYWNPALQPPIFCSPRSKVTSTKSSPDISWLSKYLSAFPPAL